MIKPALYAEKQQNGTVRCLLCPAMCLLKEKQKGICGSRYNNGGELYTDNYGEVVTIAIDPIEKKPLYHFYPGREILSTGANGCNLGCLHCQNWSISQKKIRTMYFSPEQLLANTIQHQSLGVAFTYTEPLIWYEYLLDTAPLLKENDFKVVLVTNGYINPEPLEKLLPQVDAMNIDLKGIRPEFYKKVCKGKIEPILENLKTVASSGVHLEITNLLIPGQNDSVKDITELVAFVSSLSDNIPLHFSAYHPDYKMDTPRTSAETMLLAREIAQKKLNYVYLGNVSLPDTSDTNCPACGQLLIERNGYYTRITGLNGSKCSKCDYDTGIIQ